MAEALSDKLYTSSWAYDLSKDLFSKGEIYDEDVINQSIELILGTIFGERIFNVYFGSQLASMFFENFTENNGESLLDNILQSIEQWENRITVSYEDTTMKVVASDNAIVLDIVYRINRDNIITSFKKKIIF